MPVKKKPKSSVTGQTRLADYLSEALSTVMGLGLRALPLLCIVAGIAVGCVALWQSALRDSRFRIAGDTLSLSGATRFCPEAVAEVECLGKQAAGRSLLDPWLLRDLRAAYEKSSWVKRVTTMRRVFPNRLAVEFVLRAPRVQVLQSGYYWMVDDEGVLLKVQGRRAPVDSLPVVVGTQTDALGMRPGRPGQPWQDPGVLDALGVLDTLEASPLSDAVTVRKVVVHGGSFLSRLRKTVRKRPRLDLETDRAVTIRWGTYNAGDLPDEMLSAEKVAMLRTLVARDFAKVPGVCLDVRTRIPGFTLPGEQ